MMLSRLEKQMMNEIKITPVDPKTLRPTTQDGQQMASLARAVDSSLRVGKKIRPADVLNVVFANGTTAEPQIAKADRAILTRFRLMGTVTLGTTIAGAIAFPPIAPIVLVGAAVLAITEKMRSSHKGFIQSTQQKTIEAKELIDKMVKTLDEAAQNHSQQRTPQSKKQLDETLEGFASIFSDELGYVSERVFNGKQFRIRTPEYKTSPYINKINSALKTAIGIAESAGTAGRTDSPGIGGVGREPFNRDLRSDQSIQPNTGQGAITPKIDPPIRGPFQGR